MEGFIYLIENTEKQKLYLGSTNNPASRIAEHNRGHCKTTRKYIPWKCLLIMRVGTLQEARKIEYYIKNQKEKFTIKNIVKILNRYNDKHI